MSKLRRGDIVGLLGPNGAGKASTAFDFDESNNVAITAVTVKIEAQLPGLTQWGLIVMAALLAPVFIWRRQRVVRRARV